MHRCWWILLALGAGVPSCHPVRSHSLGNLPGMASKMVGGVGRPMHLALTGGGGAAAGVLDAIEDDEGVTIYRHDQGVLEVAPTLSLKTKDQDKGVDYGCNGFMFDVVVGKRPIVITGMQICSAHGTPFDYKVNTAPCSWTDAMTDHERWTLCGGGNKVYVPDHEHGQYGVLPWAVHGVRVEAGQTRAFCIHSKDATTAVGYRLAGEVMSFPGERVGNDKPPSGPTGELTCRDRTFVTDEDENIKIVSGRRIIGLDPFVDGPHEGKDQMDRFVRAFTGVVEYEFANSR